jgi:hypothetical protein
MIGPLLQNFSTEIGGEQRRRRNCGFGGQVRKSLAGCLLLVLCGALAGCGGSSTSGPAGASSAPSSTLSQPPTSASSPSAPPKTLNATELNKGLVTARDLGSPWIQPKSVNSAGSKGEICPGHQSATTKVLSKAAARADFTEGKGAGKNIASFSLSTVPGPDSSALRAAFATDHKVCGSYQDAAGFYVVQSPDGPESVTNADELVDSWSERIYYDKSHKKLAYARHYLVARTDQLITYVSYAFLTTKKDPGAKDFTRASKLLAVQLNKNAKVFS